MTRKQDRARAKRRYARRAASREAARHRRHRVQLVAGAVIAILVVAGGILGLSRMMDKPTRSAGTAASTTTCTPAPALPKAPATYDAPPSPSIAQDRAWDAVLTTNCGTIELELYGDKAPQTVASFVFLAGKGYYDDSPCHRLTTTDTLKVLQCGDPTGTGTGTPGYGYGVENVPTDGSYPAGTVAMARGSSTTSNGSQFFITYGDSTLPTDTGGYTIFGKVTKGLDILTRIAQGGTSNAKTDGPPAQPISIESITVTPR